MNGASYEELLKRWRFAGIHDTIFHGISGDYYSARMRDAKSKLTGSEQVAVSKRVGWDQ